jgi:Protein of unknown function (DUF3592)
MSISPKNFWLWFGGIWLFCGLPFLIIGLYTGAQTLTLNQRLVAEGQMVEGMVLTKALTFSSSSSNRNSTPTYKITFRFTAPSGLVTDEAEVTADAWDSLIEREPIQVTYVPDAPQFHRVKGQTSEWIMPITTTVIGGIFTGIGGFIFLRARTRLQTNTRLQREGVVAEATVLEVRLARIRINGVQQWLVRYQYQDNRGQVQDGSEHLSPEDAANWKEGDKVTIRYDQRHPDRSLWIGRP